MVDNCDETRLAVACNKMHLFVANAGQPCPLCGCLVFQRRFCDEREKTDNELRARIKAAVAVHNNGTITLNPEKKS
jgi:hypothetical protein